MENKDGNRHGRDGRKVTALGYDHSDIRSREGVQKEEENGCGIIGILKIMTTK